MKIIKVTWRDSNQELYQREVSDLLEIEELQSIGWVIFEDENKLVIARDLLNKDKDCRGMIAIPKENVTSYKYL